MSTPTNNATPPAAAWPCWRSAEVRASWRETSGTGPSAKNVDANATGQMHWVAAKRDGLLSIDVDGPMKPDEPTLY